MRVTIANVLTGLSVTLLSLIALAILVSLAVQYRRRHNTRHIPIRISQQLTQNDVQRASTMPHGDTAINLENGIVEKSDDNNIANSNSRATVVTAYSSVNTTLELHKVPLNDKNNKLQIPWNSDVENLQLRNDLAAGVDQSSKRSNASTSASVSASREKGVALGMDMLGIGTSVIGNGNNNDNVNGNGNVNDNETNNVKLKKPQKIRWSFFSRQEFAA